MGPVSCSGHLAHPQLHGGGLPQLLHVGLVGRLEAGHHQPVAHLLLRRLVGRRAAGRLRADLDDAVAALHGHRVGDAPHGEREGHLLEVGVELALGELAEVAPVGARGGLRVGPRQGREVLARPRLLHDLAGERLAAQVLLDQDLLQGDRGRLRELGRLQLLVLGQELRLGGLDLRLDVPLHDGPADHPPLDVLPQLAEGEALALEGLLELLLARDLVVLLDAVDRLVDPLRGGLDPGVLRLLEEQDLVDRVLEDLGVVLAQEGPDVRGVDARPLGRRDLARLELGEGDDLAVHLGHDPLDDLGLAPPRGGGRG